MSLHPNHDTMVDAYDLLRGTLPFRRWKLPHSDDVEFHCVPLAGNAQAEHYVRSDNERHVFRLNPKRHGTIFSVLQTMAHEMCHMREYQLGSRRKGCHGALFNRLADQVCRIHGFDRGQF